MKKIFFVIIATFLSANVFAQTFTITNVLVNNQPIPVGGAINFGNNSAVNVKFKVEFLKPSSLSLGEVRYAAGEVNIFGSWNWYYSPEVFTLNAGSTGFVLYYDRTLYANDYSYQNNNYISAILKQTTTLQPLEWETNRVRIVREPVFTLTPSNVVLQCGDLTSKTFVADNFYNSPGNVQYRWNFGASSGWKLGNTVITSSFTTTSGTLVLTPVSNSVLPADVSVTPIYDNVAKTTLISTVTRPLFKTNATITGNPLVCIGSNGLFSINNLEAGSTVTWNTSSNASVVTLSNATNTQVQVNGISNGLINLLAIVTNACGQTDSKTFLINIGVPFFPNGPDTADLWVRQNFYAISIDTPAVLGASSYAWTISPGVDFPAVCPLVSPRPPRFNNNLQTITTTTPTVMVSFGNCLGQHLVTCIASNVCGSAESTIRYVTVGKTGTSPCFKSNNFVTSKSFVIQENPIKDGNLRIKKNANVPLEDLEIIDTLPVSNIAAGDSPCLEQWPKPYIGKSVNTNPNNTKELSATEIRVYDFYGREVYTTSIPKEEIEISVKDLNLKQGKYILHISDGGEVQRQIIVIE